jgi:hypothetical protein
MILSAASGDEEMVQGMHDLLQQWTDAEQAEVLFSARRGIGGDVAVESPVSVQMWQRQTQLRPLHICVVTAGGAFSRPHHRGAASRDAPFD